MENQKLITSITLMMAAIKISEELVTLMALKNLIDDYRDFLESTVEKTQGTELVECIIMIAEDVYQRKLQDVPEYEKIIDKYLYENCKGRHSSDDGDNVSDKDITR